MISNMDPICCGTPAIGEPNHPGKAGKGRLAFGCGQRRKVDSRAKKTGQSADLGIGMPMGVDLPRDLVLLLSLHLHGGLQNVKGGSTMTASCADDPKVKQADRARSRYTGASAKGARPPSRRAGRTPGQTHVAFPQQRPPS